MTRNAHMRQRRVTGAGCVQEALRAWVSRFQYRPVAAATAAVVDWMGVTAARGG
jgi:hypothetical protein